MRKPVLAFLLALAPPLAAQGHPFGTERIVRGSRNFPGSVQIADLDYDGRSDLLVANAFGFDVLRGVASAYLLDANYKIRNENDLPPSGEPGLVAQAGILLEDLNGDRLVDLVSISDRAVLTVFLHDGIESKKRKGVPRYRKNGKSFVLKVGKNPNLSVAGLKLHGALLVDLDGLPPKEMVLTGDLVSFFEIVQSTGISLVKFDKKGNPVSETVLQPGRYIDLAAGDLDGDGDQDLVALNSSNKVTVLRNMGSGKFIPAAFSLGGSGRGKRIELRDLNRDGRADVLVGSTGPVPRLRIYPGTRNGTLASAVSVPLPKLPKHAIEGIVARDFDRDGKQDLALLMSSDTSQAAVLHLAGRGKFVFTGASVLGLSQNIPTHETPTFVNLIQAADLDGDLAEELVLGSINDPRNQKMVQILFPNLTKTGVGVRWRGKGVRGSDGIIPAIAVRSGRPVLGDASFAVGLSYAKGGGSHAILFLSPRYIPLTYMGLTWQSFPSFVLVTKTTGAGRGGGMAFVPMSIPKDPRLPGITWFMQWVVADRGAGNLPRLALSPSLEVRVAKSR